MSEAKISDVFDEDERDLIIRGLRRVFAESSEFARDQRHTDESREAVERDAKAVMKLWRRIEHEEEQS